MKRSYKPTGTAYNVDAVLREVSAPRRICRVPRRWLILDLRQMVSGLEEELALRLKAAAVDGTDSAVIDASKAVDAALLGPGLQ